MKIFMFEQNTLLLPRGSKIRSKSLYLRRFQRYLQGSRLRRPSILNTRYFRFGRKFRLSVRPSGRDFYEGNISALEANFGGRKRRYASNIYVVYKLGFCTSYNLYKSLYKL